MSLGFSSLKVRTNWEKKKCTQESKIGPKQTHKKHKINSWRGFELKSCQIPQLKKWQLATEMKTRALISAPSRQGDRLLFKFHKSKDNAITNVGPFLRVSEKRLNKDRRLLPSSPGAGWAWGLISEARLLRNQTCSSKSLLRGKAGTPEAAGRTGNESDLEDLPSVNPLRADTDARIPALLPEKSPNRTTFKNELFLPQIQ